MEASAFARDLDFTGKRVLVTGAANGFGRAIAELYVELGAEVVLADREPGPLAEVAGRLGMASQLYDQADLASIERLHMAVREVDILVNNAGIMVAKPLLDTSPAELRAMIDVDFVGVVRLMQLFGGGMVARGKGVVLSIGSQTAFAGGEGRGVYAAAKAAISQITRSAAVEWGPRGVRVLCLAPGRSITRMTEVTRTAASGDRGIARVPLGRWGTAEEIAKMAVFLTSDAASYITGETVIADGGFVIG
ncbi:SDR family NAD(P)-dependent oxidoreductase [Enterovirga rhinocerotis]|uniref:2-deoxy-D-gluconate 3-dehydrogenase n=1 Tax=Enterovirga rhinocerotis TaxID=1339210 RepID=A0A4V3DXI4_9HYPH|nr:SDR family oxidoreductase [Enterovirga rhinocerotis]TDR88929.1 2-deoxy-D-gluconate 3-dehydrogenase [Enterovirga rhinocerotis]